MNASPGHIDPQDTSGVVSPSLRTFFRNQERWLERLATGLPDPPDPHPHILREPGVTTVRTGRSGVMSLRGEDPASLDDLPAIERALAWLRRLGQRDVLIWSTMDRPALTLSLLARGLDLSFRPAWMARSLLEPLPANTVSDVLIRIATPDDIRHLAATPAIPYLVPEQLEATRSLALHPEPPVVRWLVARDRSGVVGQAIVHLTDDIAGLFNVAVHPRARRRGIGRALTLSAMRIAREAGATEMALNSTPDGLAMYEGLGFRHIGEGTTWLLPARRSRLVPAPYDVEIAEAIGAGRIAALETALLPPHLPNGDLPMAFAARFGQDETVRWLLGHGAVPDALALWDSEMPEDAARAMTHREFRDHPSGPERATPLHHAVRRGDAVLVELLVEAGASLSARDAQFQATPLEWAEHLGHEEIARIIRRAARR